MSPPEYLFSNFNWLIVGFWHFFWNLDFNFSSFFFLENRGNVEQNIPELMLDLAEMSQRIVENLGEILFRK